MKRLVAILVSVALAVGLVPASAFAQAGEQLAVQAGQQLIAAQASSASVQAVQAAYDAAVAYAAEREFKSPALKDALEYQLPDALCYSTAEDVFYILRDNGAFICANGVVSAAGAAQQIPVYDSLAAAREAHVSDDAFITRGLASKGDKGHAYYVRTDGDLPHETVPATAPIDRGDKNATYALDVRIDGAGYRLTSAESALSIYQLGYQGGDVQSFVQGFVNTSFHTLTFPKGEYRLGSGVWQWRDDKAVYGFDATLYTDDGFKADDMMNSVWLVRGEIRWGTPDYYGTLTGHEVNGLRFERRTSEGHGAGYGYGMFVRNAHDVTFNHCAFIDDGQGVTCYEFYGNYEDVNLLNCEGRGYGVIEIRDLSNEGGCRNIVVRGCDFHMTSHDEGLPIFAGNEEGLKDKNGVEYPILENCLVENLVIEKNKFVMAKPTSGKPRVVGITCGYQDSPVRNVHIRNNDFDMCVDNNLILFGYAENCSFSGNRVKLSSSAAGRSLVLVERANHSRTKPSHGIVVSDNVITCDDETTTLLRLADKDLGDNLTFSGNALDFAGSVSKLMNSTATYENDRFNLNKVSALYSDVREVRGNAYSIGWLGALYEADGANVQEEVAIEDEVAVIAETSADNFHLMTFNNAPHYNGHGITFAGCRYDMRSDPYRWRTLSYSAEGIADAVTITLADCYIANFMRAPYNEIAHNESGKATVVITPANQPTDLGDANVQVVRFETQTGDGDFVDSADAALLVREPLLSRDALGIADVSGTPLATFSLQATRQFGYGEVTLSVAGAAADGADGGSVAAADGDVVALYRESADGWAPYGYYQVKAGAFTVEVTEADLGRFALVNKTATGDFEPVDIATLAGSSGQDKLWRALAAGGSYKAGQGAGRVSIARRYMNQAGAYASRLEFRGLDLYCTDTSDNNGFTFAAAGGNDFYFQDCTFTHLDFAFFAKGTYAFVNCTFTEYPRNAIAAQADGARVFAIGCTFADNAPDKEAWNRNKSGDRHAKYAAVRLRGPNSSLHVVGSTFSNLQTDSTLIVEKDGDDDYENVTVCFERNRMTDCGGAGLVMDNAVRGRIDGNEFRNIGATRGMNGYESTIHPTLGEYDAAGKGMPGAGVGGNAVFGRGRNVQMRVREWAR